MDFAIKGYVASLKGHVRIASLHSNQTAQKSMTNPNYRMILSYDIHPEKYERYYNYVLSEFVPGMQKMGLQMIFAWQIIYGRYPARQIDFICYDYHTLTTVLSSETFKQAEERLKSYTINYKRKVVYFENRFQF